MIALCGIIIVKATIRFFLNRVVDDRRHAQALPVVLKARHLGLVHIGKFKVHRCAFVSWIQRLHHAWSSKGENVMDQPAFAKHILFEVVLSQKLCSQWDSVVL